MAKIWRKNDITGKSEKVLNSSEIDKMLNTIFLFTFKRISEELKKCRFNPEDVEFDYQYEFNNIIYEVHVY